ncbi:MAG: DUF512 domain-containing protein, partial [candidate division Zixibacteria bacterium]|nr:DUF512 domain-containing protein [candidate division Zixibacteria bacterium]
AVVPVGLTRYRDKLPELRTYTRDEARTIVNRLETVQKELLDRLGSRFVWPADEFYVTAELPFPSRAGYEDMQQFENGVGMAREFITNFNRRRSRLKGLDTSRRVLFLTGESAFPFLTREIMPYVTQHLRLKAELSPVKNRFWGNSVTVSGLLTGQDLLRRARARVSDIDTVVLPPNCLNHDDLFLDNMSLTQFSTALDRRVVVGQYQFADTLREVYS